MLLVFVIVGFIWVCICGAGLYWIESKLADPRNQLQFQRQQGLLLARRFCLILVSVGLGVMTYQLFVSLTLFSWLSSSSDTKTSMQLVAWVSLIVFSIPTIIFSLAIFSKKFVRIAYLTFSIIIFPAFLVLVCFSIYHRFKDNSISSFFPVNTTIILVSWGTLGLFIVSQVLSLVLWTPTPQEMAAEDQQRFNEAVEYVEKQKENERLLEDSLEEFELTYIEDWQQSSDHRIITVQIGAQGKSIVTVEKNSSVTTRVSFYYPVDALANLIELLTDDSFQTLQDQYCQSPGQCLHDSATYTLTMSLAGEEKTVRWGQGDPQAQTTILNTIGVTILRYVPIDMYD